MKRNIVIVAGFVFLLLGCSKNTVGESLKDISDYTKYTGCEYKITEELFLVRSFGQLYLIEPVPEDNVLGKLTNSPTIKSFKDKTWDKKNYTGDYEYLEIIPKGTQLKVVDIVRTTNLEVGVTYHVYAKFINSSIRSENEIDVSWIVNDKEKPEKLSGAALIKCE